MSTELRRRLAVPIDAAGIAAFRVVFGVIVAVSATRFLAAGWVDALFVRPRIHFTYWGFGWVRALPDGWMHALFVAVACLGLLVAAGLFYRVAVVLLFIGFAYLQLVDVANYLNHYYLVTLLAGLLCFIPAHRYFSVDACWRRPDIRSATLPVWCLYLLRFQVAVVYFNAGLAKLTGDWLLHAEPLNIWLSAHADLPLLGPLMETRAAAFVASWFGFLFDGTIVFFLLARRTRAAAYLVVLAFHLATAVLFPIGMFPIIMVTAAWVFFHPAWPRRLLERLRGILVRAERPLAGPSPTEVPTRTSVGGAPARPFGGRVFPAYVAVAGAFMALQLFLPLRAHAYGGNVLWHEQGFRFAWKVMAREKNGSVTFIIRDPRGGREWHVPPRQYLTQVQEQELSVQPDLILQLARRIAHDFEAAGRGPVEVRAEAWVSLNGRRSALLIDPDVDLAREEDSLRPKTWIMPAPTSPPAHLRPLSATPSPWAGRAR